MNLPQQNNENKVSGIDPGATVNFHLEFAKEWLADDEITEICVNRPYEVWCERQGKWEKHDVKELDYAFCMSIATAVAKFSADEIADTKPILSAVLPKGQRIQVVRPPACESGTVVITIRKPSFKIWTLSDYEKQGFFKHLKPSPVISIPDNFSRADAELLDLSSKGEFISFFRRAVQLEKVIVVAGETGSGKTTFMKALTQEIPVNKRIITIEDTPELFLPSHPNHVHLFYPSEAKEEDNAPLTSAILQKCCMRLKPSYIMPAELRAGEAFDFLMSVLSGHGGSITSIHSGSCDMAFERLALMILQNRQGRTLPYDVIRRLLYLSIDIVIHVHNDVDYGLGRHISEIWFDPLKKREMAKG